MYNTATVFFSILGTTVAVPERENVETMGANIFRQKNILFNLQVIFKNAPLPLK